MAAWVAAIADNVRNPVNGIGAALDLLERELLVHRLEGQCDELLVADSLRRIRGRLLLLGEYVSELVDFAKPAVVHPEPVQLARCLDEVRTAVSLALPAVTVEIQVDPTTTVQADPRRLQAALKAVLKNAMEAALAASRGPRVLVSAARTAVGNRAGTALAVADNGSGFPEAAHQRLFEPFYSTKEAGTGLGLAIARKVLAAHGGTLTVATSPALGGALVTLFIPDPKTPDPKTAR